MNTIKSAQILAALCVLGAVSPVLAASTEFYNFENLPSTYWSDSSGVTIGGQQDIAGYYAGIDFNAGVQGVHTSSGYPAHSGVLEIEQTGILNPTISFTLGNGGLPVAQTVSFWYTTLDGFTATAYNSMGAVVSRTTVPNTTGLAGTDSFVSLSDPLGNISSVTITDPYGVGNFTTIDDISVTAPDATSTMGLLGLAAAGMLAFRRKIVTQ